LFYRIIFQDYDSVKIIRTDSQLLFYRIIF